MSAISRCQPVPAGISLDITAQVNAGFVSLVVPLHPSWSHSLPRTMDWRSPGVHQRDRSKQLTTPERPTLVSSPLRDLHILGGVIDGFSRQPTYWSPENGVLNELGWDLASVSGHQHTVSLFLPVKEFSVI